MMDNSALVTDDELAAWMSREVGGRYYPVLPTVAVADAEALSAAVLRGLRSLAVRAAADDSPVSERLDAMLRGGDGAPPVRVMNIDLANPTRYAGSSLAITPVGDRVVVDVAAQNGIHNLWSASVAEALAMVRDMVATAQTEEAGRGAYALALYTAMPGAHDTFVVRGGQAVSARVEIADGGQPVFTVLGDPVDTAQAAGALLESARARAMAWGRSAVGAREG